MSEKSIYELELNLKNAIIESIKEDNVKSKLQNVKLHDKIIELKNILFYFKDEYKTFKLAPEDNINNILFFIENEMQTKDLGFYPVIQ